MTSINCTGFYNSEMESNYIKLYRNYLKIKKYKSLLENHKKPFFNIHKKQITQADIDSLITRFELNYYKVSKMNFILNKVTKEQKPFIPYLEPTTWKNRVDKAAKELGIKPYEELSKRDQEFIYVQ